MCAQSVEPINPLLLKFRKWKTNVESRQSSSSVPTEGRSHARTKSQVSDEHAFNLCTQNQLQSEYNVPVGHVKIPVVEIPLDFCLRSLHPALPRQAMLSLNVNVNHVKVPKSS